MSRDLAQEPDIRIGSLLVAPSTCEVEYEGKREALEPQVMQVLLSLAQSEGKVVSRDGLVETCWDGRAISEDAINRVITRLRRLSRECGAFEIMTVRKVGYRLTPLLSAETGNGRIEEADANRKALPRALSFLARQQRARLPALLLLGLIMVPAIGAGFSLGQSKAESYSVRIVPFDTTDARLSTVATDLTARMTDSLSRMRGVHLIDGAAKSLRPDLTLSGAIEAGAGDEDVNQPAIRLMLTDEKTHRPIWSASFEPGGTAAPTPSDRAIAATARYIAVVLGRKSTARSAAGEPLSPEVLGLIESARRRLALAHDARHNRDWSRFIDLMAEVDRNASEALAREPNASDALMLKFEVNALPQYPYEGESEADYRARQSNAETFLARAVAADPDNPYALAAAGRDFMVRQRWDESENLLLRAVAIDPNSSDGNLWYAFFLSLTNRCDEGLKYAEVAVSLTPDDVWRQLAIPRLLHCSGQHEKAAQIYIDLIDQNPGNVFVLREYYLMRLAQDRPDALRDISEHVLVDLWKNAPPEDVSAMLKRIDYAADALDGRPTAYLAALDADFSAIGVLSAEGYTDLHDRARGRGTFIGKDVGDSLFALALEYAMAHQDDRSVECLREAIEQSSLYLPWVLPYGATPLPTHVTTRKDYKALWRSRPELADLMKRRKRAAPWSVQFQSWGEG